MRGLLSSLLRIDRSAVDAGFTIRCAIGAGAALLLGYASGQPLLAVACGLGAISTGFASLQGVYRTRAAIMLTMALAMAATTFLGTLAARSIPIELSALALCGLGYGLFSALGAAASAVALQATIALVIFSNFPLAPRSAAECAFYVVVGALIQTMLLVSSWPMQRYPEERHALAGAFTTLARYAREIDCANPTLPPASPLAAVEETLADPRPFGRRAAYAAFQTLFDEAERIRATLGRISATSCAGYLPVRDTVARALESFGDALAHANAPNDLALLAQLNATPDDEAVRALFGALRAVWRNIAIPFRGRMLGTAGLPTIEWFDWEESLAVLRSNARLDAPFGRHAVRVSVTLALTGMLAHVLPLERGYWMTLTAALVLRPDFTTTVARGIARIIGTLLGVGVATALVVALPDTPHVMLALAIVFAAFGYAAFQMNYALYTVTITAYVVFILSLIGTPEHTAIVSRTVATLIGGSIAMLTYIFWPTWESPHTRARLLDLVRLDRGYARTLFTGLIDPSRRDGKRLREERVSVWATRAAAEASLERMLAEPRTNDEIPRDIALGIMAATQRIGLANLVLATIYESADTPALPQLAPFARALETAFASSQALLSGTPAPSLLPLREAYAELERDLTWGGRDALLATLDIMVDAVNTMGELAARAAMPGGQGLAP